MLRSSLFLQQGSGFRLGPPGLFSCIVESHCARGLGSVKEELEAIGVATYALLIFPG